VINGDSELTTTIDGGKLDRVFDIKPGALVTLSRMRIINGNEPTNSGGAIATDGSLNLQQAVIEKNYAGNAGGGISVGSLGYLYMFLVRVSKNSSGGNGGGIYSQGTFLQANYLVLNKNKAGNYGGGLFNTGAPPYIVQALITGTRPLLCLKPVASMTARAACTCRQSSFLETTAATTAEE